MAVQPYGVSATPQSFVSPANLLSIRSVPSVKSLMSKLNNSCEQWRNVVWVNVWLHESTAGWETLEMQLSMLSHQTGPESRASQ